MMGVLGEEAVNILFVKLLRKTQKETRHSLVHDGVHGLEMVDVQVGGVLREDLGKEEAGKWQLHQHVLVQRLLTTPRQQHGS